ncbi:hypothetical protein [Jiangella alkaliphila]|uniref:Secreted protein n=1 Tax=Jiangella alkaliphila TaxID=419479 RepID=A0A1H2KXR7_9ACTN|nr:hypothetical protein [Jiangella alkaliphila]SDU73284.1 hypothetical protein SAMN04488563_4507 [Jiangella alkaliphila]
MLKKFTGLLAAAALSAATLAGGATAATAATTQAEPAPSSGPITAMSWHRSPYYPNAATCMAVLASQRAAGVPTMPGTGPCYSSAQGYFFWYWR